MTDAETTEQVPEAQPPGVEASEEHAPDAQLAAARPAPRTRRWRLWVTITASVLLSAGAVTGAGYAWQAIATAQSTSAYREVVAASKALTDVTDEREIALDKARASLFSMAVFTDHPRPDYLAVATAKALSDAEADLEAKSLKLPFAVFTPPKVTAASADLMPWTVIGDVQHKAQLAHDEHRLARTRASELKALDAAQAVFSTSAHDVYRELAAHGEQVLTADDSATYASKVDLRHAIDAGAGGVVTGAFGGTGLVYLIQATDGVTASQAAGEAAKQDPAYPIRAQIEAYARSIAHGVTLDFEWHAEVRGLGEGWYSGTTQYHAGDGGWATIDLNFPIQDGWARGDVDAKALITHEVGHSQVVRPACKALFDGPAFRDDDEMWATAWAISMGFDTAGSGIEAYGRPSDEQIAVAGQCR